jgi:hypothetical protein
VLVVAEGPFWVPRLGNPATLLAEGFGGPA